MKAYLSLIGLLCPKIKKIINQPIGIYKPPISTSLILLCFVFAAKAQEIEVHSTPVAKAASRIERKEFVRLKIGDNLTGH